MAVDYHKQYTPQQLAPFWPNEVIRILIVVLCTVAVITALAVLPVVLDSVGLSHLVERSEPADPRVTPPHLKPEWYFLATYQFLKLPPQELLGMSGKTVGVLAQGLFMLALLTVPFWALRRRSGHPGALHHFVVTLVLAVFVGLMLWAAWPPPLLMTISVVVVLALFYGLLARERHTIGSVLDPDKRGQA